MNEILEAIGKWLSSVGGITVIATFCLSIVVKTVMNIWNKAMLYKTNLISKKEWAMEKQALLMQMNNMKSEIREEMMNVIKAEMKAEIKDLKQIREMVNRNANVDKLIDEKIKQLNDRFSRQDQIEAKIVYLDRRMNKIENGSTDDTFRRNG